MAKQAKSAEEATTVEKPAIVLTTEQQSEATLIKNLLAHKAGFDVSVLEDALVIRLCVDAMTKERCIEVGWRWRVNGTPTHGWEVFPSTSLYDAVKCFVAKRHELRIGDDMKKEVGGE